MEAQELKILQTELNAQAREIERIFHRIDDRAGLDTPSGVESLAYQLHNLYSAFEELLEIVARAFENHIAGAGTYHIELLRRMSVEVEGVRPAFVPEDLLPALDRLRSFLHFFRHAYGQEIDRRRMKPLIEDADLVRLRYPQMISSFLDAFD